MKNSFVFFWIIFLFFSYWCKGQWITDMDGTLIYINPASILSNNIKTLKLKEFRYNDPGVRTLVYESTILFDKLGLVDSLKYNNGKNQYGFSHVKQDLENSSRLLIDSRKVGEYRSDGKETKYDTLHRMVSDHYSYTVATGRVVEERYFQYDEQSRLIIETFNLKNYRNNFKFITDKSIVANYIYDSSKLLLINKKEINKQNDNCVDIYETIMVFGYKNDVLNKISLLGGLQLNLLGEIEVLRE